MTKILKRSRFVEQCAEFSKVWADSEIGVESDRAGNLARELRINVGLEKGPRLTWAWDQKGVRLLFHSKNYVWTLIYGLILGAVVKLRLCWGLKNGLVPPLDQLKNLEKMNEIEFLSEVNKQTSACSNFRSCSGFSSQLVPVETFEVALHGST